MQYLYNDENLYYFMDNETYEQIPLNKEQIGDALKFIKENMNVKRSLYTEYIVDLHIQTTGTNMIRHTIFTIFMPDNSILRLCCRYSYKR